MPTAKRVDLAAPSYSDLSARFQQYGCDTPENGFPTFLEALLFERETDAPKPRAAQRRERRLSPRSAAH
jgi:hypothetical protein